ncbi:endonuclease/exonuclease/phosphatase family protein [Thauera humireducens]|uniref:endonuclease/exonuclease/phosphatase family protein n=1 Tax=Thauera humireducens TaxID=1134435 RepID=UPI00311FF136
MTLRAKILLALAVLGGALPWVSAALPTSTLPTLAWLIDLGTHFQWLYLMIGGISLAWLLAKRTHGWLLVALAGVVVSGFSASPSSSRIDAAALTPSDTRQLTIVTANLNVSTVDLAPLHAWLGTIDADVLVLQELNPRAAAAVSKWPDYPHQILTPREDPFGIAIISRHPLESSELLERAGHTPQIHTQVVWGDTRFVVSAVHPMPPISADFHLRRAELFTSEASWASSQPLPSIIAGDFNASPWSSAMQTLAAAGLIRATSLQATWPSALPVIPIDQIVTSEHWSLIEAGVGPDVGSDHRPAFARVAPLPRAH